MHWLFLCKISIILDPCKSISKFLGPCMFYIIFIFTLYNKNGDHKTPKWSNLWSFWIMCFIKTKIQTAIIIYTCIPLSKYFVIFLTPNLISLWSNLATLGSRKHRFLHKKCKKLKFYHMGVKFEVKMGNYKFIANNVFYKYIACSL